MNFPFNNLFFRLMLLVGGLLGFARCQNTNTTKDGVTEARMSTPIQDLDVDNFERQLGQANTLLLDVRTPEEYAEGHLAGAVLIDIYNNEFDKKIAELDTTKTILVYCAAGKRSAKAAEKLRKIGFAHINNLKNGYNDWVANGKAIVK